MNRNDDATYFLVPGDEDNKIMKVKGEDRGSFVRKFEGKILLEAGSVQELIIQLSDLLNHSDITPPAALFR